MNKIKVLLFCITLYVTSTNSANVTNTNSTNNGCIKVCEKLQLYNCEVCYEQCEQVSKKSGSPKKTFAYKSCKQHYCSLTKRFYQTDKNGKRTSQQYCVDYDTKKLNQKDCLEECCGEYQKKKFTPNNLQQCLEYNQSTTKWIYIVSAALVFLVIAILGCPLLCDELKSKQY